jgi:hypothetical protein
MRICGGAQNRLRQRLLHGAYASIHVNESASSISMPKNSEKGLPTYQEGLRRAIGAGLAHLDPSVFHQAYQPHERYDSLTTS